MSGRERAEGMVHKIQEHSPTSRQVLGMITLVSVGGTVLFLGGLTLTGTVTALILLTPVFIFFSPILVPVGIALFLGAAGLLTAGSLSVGAVAAVSWIYNYLKGRHPPGSEQIDYARKRIADTANQMKHRAREYGGLLQAKAQEAAPGA